MAGKNNVYANAMNTGGSSTLQLLTAQKAAVISQKLIDYEHNTQTQILSRNQKAEESTHNITMPKTISQLEDTLDIVDLNDTAPIN